MYDDAVVPFSKSWHRQALLHIFRTDADSVMIPGGEIMTAFGK